MVSVRFTASFPFQFNQGVEAIFEEVLEISLDCAFCLKKARTIIVDHPLLPDQLTSAKPWLGLIMIEELQLSFPDLTIESYYPSHIPLQRGVSCCTPTLHPFPAQIKDFTVSQHKGITTALYTVEYDYTPFEDTRLAWSYNSSSHEMPTWGRLYFDIICPNCGHKQHESAKTSTIRPYKSRCLCEYFFYEEKEDDEIPLFERV